MTQDATQRAAEILAEHRASIDRLDAILVYTLAERFKAYYEQAGREVRVSIPTGSNTAKAE